MNAPSTVTFKERAVQRLKEYYSNRKEYVPSSYGTEDEFFMTGPILYYRVFDSDFRPTTALLAHTIDELYFMAIDNARKLGTLNTLFQMYPDFSASNMCLRHMILTSFVGTGEGKTGGLFCCPQQSESPFSMTTKLFAIAISETIVNTVDSPTRIALEVKSTHRKWSTYGSSGFHSFFSRTKKDSGVLDLNARVNRGQIVQLRNDPEGCVRYSKAALEAMHQEELAVQRAKQGEIDAIETAKREEVEARAAALAAEHAVPDSMGTAAYNDSGPSPSDPIAILHPRQALAKGTMEARTTNATEITVVPETKVLEDEVLGAPIVTEDDLAEAQRVNSTDTAEVQNAINQLMLKELAQDKARERDVIVEDVNLPLLAAVNKGKAKDVVDGDT